ncbi:CopG family transcriptional regulator [Inquilinus limosus]|uniref:CopG family transcriptional regulator n=1 Tax=Inquilinus limosus TaxID=171674 RepID=A0A211ZHA2_9PROT|nr:CopG family transcriptional regulator [Inquilinus limosus]OWJ64620.1 CopG family transcriptional regulator [Inquilinus limosus]
MKTRLNVYFSPDLLRRIEDLAQRKRLSRSSIVEAAVASFLSPDGADQREAAVTRRLDRLSRQFERLERDVGISVEALALFVRFWLTVTPPLPGNAQAAAQAKGRERYRDFLDTLGRRLAKGRGLLQEIPSDMSQTGSNSGAAGSSEPTADGRDPPSEAFDQR